MGASELEGTLEVTDEKDKAQTTTKKKKGKPAYLQSLNESEK
jgi:hypothetical protein